MPAGEQSRYGFRRATLSDLPLLTTWQSNRHVRDWWGDEPAYDEDHLDDPRVTQWIVALDGTPFAYMQDYDVHGWDEHPFFHLPAGSRGIDQFIGEVALTGKGHGPAFIRQKMSALFDAGAPVIATDPHPENARAISAYRKAGFQIVGAPKETKWGVILPMTAER